MNAAATVWNQLPNKARTANSINISFKKSKPKAALFRQAYNM